MTHRGHQEFLNENKKNYVHCLSTSEDFCGTLLCVSLCVCACVGESVIGQGAVETHMELFSVHVPLAKKNKLQWFCSVSCPTM